MRWILLLAVLLWPSWAQAQPCKWPSDCSGDAANSDYDVGTDTDWSEVAPSTTAAALNELALRQGGSFVCEATETIDLGDIVASAGQGAKTVSADGVYECSVANQTLDSLYIVGVARQAAASGERFVVMREGFEMASVILATDSPLGGAFTNCDADGEIVTSGLLAANTICFAPGSVPALRQPWGIWVEDGADDMVWVMSADVGVSGGFDASTSTILNAQNFHNLLNTVNSAFTGVDDRLACLVRLYSAINPTETLAVNDFMSMATHLGCSGSACETTVDDYVIPGGLSNKLGHLVCTIDVPPGLTGGTDEYAIVARTGPIGTIVDTALTCTISGTDFGCSSHLSFPTADPALTVGETITIEVDSSGSPTLPDIAAFMECSMCIIP